MPRFVYGDSYGDVANRELSLDSARDRRFFESVSASQRAQQQMADEAYRVANFRQSERQAQQDALQRTQALAHDVGLNKARFAIGLKEMEQGARQHEASLGLQREQFAQRGDQFERGFQADEARFNIGREDILEQQLIGERQQDARIYESVNTLAEQMNRRRSLTDELGSLIQGRVNELIEEHMSQKNAVPPTAKEQADFLTLAKADPKVQVLLNEAADLGDNIQGLVRSGAGAYLGQDPEKGYVSKYQRRFAPLEPPKSSSADKRRARLEAGRQLRESKKGLTEDAIVRFAREQIAAGVPVERVIDDALDYGVELDF